MVNVEKESLLLFLFLSILATDFFLQSLQVEKVFVRRDVGRVSRSDRGFLLAVAIGESGRRILTWW